MSPQSIPELLAVIERTHALRAAHEPTSAEWESASKRMAELIEEMRQRTSVAVGHAFAATLMGLSQRDLDKPSVAGERFLAELRKRGLTVSPQRYLPPR